MEPLVIPTGIAVYDSLMAAIEPDLLSTNIDTLNEKYKDESDEENKARCERYTHAFDAYDSAYAKWEMDMNTQVNMHRRRALRSAEEDSRTEESSILGNLESTFSSAA